MLQKERNQFLGLLMILVVITCWVASSFVLKILFETLVYNKPCFVTYINVSSLSLYLIPYWLRQQRTMDESVDIDIDIDIDTSDTDTQPISEKVSRSEHNNTEPTLSPLETLKLGLAFCVLWFLSCFATNTSLSYTSVSSQTILFSTSSLFTLLIGSLASVERLTKSKLCGVLVSFVGVILVTKTDSNSSSSFSSNDPSTFSSTLIGDALALTGALVYGIYSTLLKKSVEQQQTRDQKIDSITRSLDLHLFFGFVGCFTMLGLWPLLVVLHVTGFEKFEVLNYSWSPAVLVLLSLSAGLTFVSDYCWAKAVLLTTPLTVSMGLSISIPVAMLGSLLFGSGIQLTYGYVVGAMMVLVAFVIVNREEECVETGKNTLSLSLRETEEVCSSSSSSSTPMSESEPPSTYYGSIV